MDSKVTHVGNYRVEREILTEPLRTVYQGWQLSLNRPVQITQLTEEGAADAALRTRWKAAAYDLRTPGHPQLPGILEGDFTADRPYLVERYIVGDTLAEQRDLQRDLRAGLKLLYGLADALAYAHRRGWAHGGVASEQVCMATDGTPYLTDLPWLAASRPQGDAGAMRGDVQALAQLFCGLMTSAVGAAPPVTGDVTADERVLAGWLGRSGGEEPDLAVQLAPVLARTLSPDPATDFPTCVELAEALRPLAQRSRPTPQPAPQPIAQTLVGPPPASVPVPAPTPQSWSPPVPLPVTPPVTPPAAAVMAARQPRWWLIGGVAIAVIALIALIFGGVTLCKRGVLPFCSPPCDPKGIQEYYRAAVDYARRPKPAWSEALRELEAAADACESCSQPPATCENAQALHAEALCHVNTERAVEDAKKILTGGGDTCQALDGLKNAYDLGCDTDLVRQPLRTAVVSCANDLLSSPAEGNCERVYNYLKLAADWKLVDATISPMYARAESYRVFKAAYDAQRWADAIKELEKLELAAEKGQYCGHDLRDFRFNIAKAQGDALKSQGAWCDAMNGYGAAQSAAYTAEQKTPIAQAFGSVATPCVASYTPTPTRTPTLTPTPTPKSVANITEDGANIRKCINADRCDSLRKGKQGEALDLICATLGSDGTWFKVSSANSEGWIRQDMVRVNVTPRNCGPSELTPTPTPRPTACRAANSLPAVQPLAPPKDKDCNGVVRFAWQWSDSLWADEEFEIHIWPDRMITRGRVTGTRDTATIVDLGKDVRWINWTDSNRAHFWEIIVVCKADGRWISEIPKPTLLYFRPTVPNAYCGP